MSMAKRAVPINIKIGSQSTVKNLLEILDARPNVAVMESIARLMSRRGVLADREELARLGWFERNGPSSIDEDGVVPLRWRYTPAGNFQLAYEVFDLKRRLIVDVFPALEDASRGSRLHFFEPDPYITALLAVQKGLPGADEWLDVYNAGGSIYALITERTGIEDARELVNTHLQALVNKKASTNEMRVFFKAFPWLTQLPWYSLMMHYARVHEVLRGFMRVGLAEAYKVSGGDVYPFLVRERGIVIPEADTAVFRFAFEQLGLRINITG